MNRPLYDKFYMQKRHAKRRGIAFLLTYDEWIKIWLDSGHLNDRGRGKGKYHMGYVHKDITTETRIRMSEGQRRRSLYSDPNEQSQKLTDKKVIQIKSMINEGINQRRIAEIYGVSASTICDIKKGRIWKHLNV